MLSKLLVLGLAAIAYALPAAEIVQRDAPTGVTIKKIVFAGSGCPANSVGQFVSDDRTTYAHPPLKSALSEDFQANQIISLDSP